MKRNRLASIAATICSLSITSVASADERGHGHARGESCSTPHASRGAAHDRSRARGAQRPRGAPDYVAHPHRARPIRASPDHAWREQRAARARELENRRNARARARLVRGFYSLDVDRDRRLSRWESRLSARRFWALDRDGNGYLTRRELGSSRDWAPSWRTRG